MVQGVWQLYLEVAAMQEVWHLAGGVALVPGGSCHVGGVAPGRGYPGTLDPG